MGLFDSLKQQAEMALKRETTKSVNSAVNSAVNTAANTVKNEVGKGKNRTETFTFDSLPANLAQLQSLNEASLDSPFKTTALAIAVLCNYEKDLNATIEMLDFLKGPESVSEREKQFYKDRLAGKVYKVYSYFDGATPQNNYTPSQPYTIKVSENPYSFDNENWATLYVTSGGADNPRPVKLRKKPSTGQWFINEIQCLSDIRVPVESDPWA